MLYSEIRSIRDMVETRAASRKRKNHQDHQQDQPRKRIRRHRGSRNGQSYFDNVPQDAVENIIRFTSDRPRSANWKGYVSAEVALSLLKSKTALTTCCRSLFSSLETRVRRTERHTSLVVRGSGDRSRHQFTSLVSALRESLTEIVINRETFPATWKRCLISKCPRLKRLSLSTSAGNVEFELSEILSVHRGTLEFLRISKPCINEEDVVAISEFGSGLKGLHLNRWLWSARMGHVWESIGANLEELLVAQSVAGTDVDLPSITRNCTRLRKLHFSDFSEYVNFSSALEALCTRLGDQLKSLSLKDCSVQAPHMARIVTACKNMEVQLQEFDGCPLPVLHAMGARAHHVDVGEDTMVYEGDVSEGLHSAFERCENLVSIRIWRRFPQVLLQTILARPKPLLMDVDARLGSFGNSGLLFETFTSNASNLRKLDMYGFLPSRSILEAFVQANPLLRTVQVRNARKTCARTETIDANGGQVDLSTAAKIFLKCENLKELVLCCSSHRVRASRMEHYASACLHARHKNVCMWICGYQYS